MCCLRMWSLNYVEFMVVKLMLILVDELCLYYVDAMFVVFDLVYICLIMFIICQLCAFAHCELSSVNFL